MKCNSRIRRKHSPKIHPRIRLYAEWLNLNQYCFASVSHHHIHITFRRNTFDLYRDSYTICSYRTSPKLDKGYQIDVMMPTSTKVLVLREAARRDGGQPTYHSVVLERRLLDTTLRSHEILVQVSAVAFNHRDVGSRILCTVRPLNELLSSYGSGKVCTH